MADTARFTPARYFVQIVAVLLFCATAALADAEHPTALEATSLVEVLKFRGGMVADPDAAIAVAHDVPAEALQRILGHMDTAGSGSDGWRYLLATSVFTAAGVDADVMLAVFYNPWVDVAVFTEWRLSDGKRTLSDVEWAAGDLVRAADPQIEPRPLWLRGEGYRPQTLAEAVVLTVRAIEERLAGDFARENWRGVLGLDTMSDVDGLVSPMLALRVFEAQVRLKALAARTEGEDATLAPLREATLRLVTTAAGEGFVPLIEEAADTREPMRAALSAMHKQTLRGLAPVAYIVGDGEAMVFLASLLTADFMIAARFDERLSGYALRQLDYVPYAAVYQASYPDSGPQIRAAEE